MLEMPDSWLLDDGEWFDLWDKYRDGGRGTQTPPELTEWKNYLCRAQARKIAGWLEGVCPHGNETPGGEPWLRRECPACFEEFREGVE